LARAKFHFCQRRHIGIIADGDWAARGFSQLFCRREANPAIIREFVRGKGLFRVTPYVPTEEVTTRMYPLLLTTGRILSQYNVGAQTRRTENLQWHDEDVLESHPHDAEQRGIEAGDWVGLKSRAGETVLRAVLTERVQPGVVYTTFHHPESGANVVTTDNSDWATNCPEYKVTAVQAYKVTRLSDWQQNFEKFTEEQMEHLRRGREPETIN
jgi:formate dehydrogenase major subunit